MNINTINQFRSYQEMALTLLQIIELNERQQSLMTSVMHDIVSVRVKNRVTQRTEKS